MSKWYEEKSRALDAMRTATPLTPEGAVKPTKFQPRIEELKDELRSYDTEGLIAEYLILEDLDDRTQGDRLRLLVCHEVLKEREMVAILLQDEAEEIVWQTGLDVEQGL